MTVDELLSAHYALLLRLQRRGVITMDPTKAHECCGFPRDEDGFCWYKPQHPIFVAPADTPRHSEDSVESAGSV